MNIAHIKYFSSKLNQTFITNQTKQLSKTVLILSIRLIKKVSQKQLKIYFSDLHRHFYIPFPFLIIQLLYLREAVSHYHNLFKHNPSCNHQHLQK